MILWHRHTESTLKESKATSRGNVLTIPKNIYYTAPLLQTAKTRHPQGITGFVVIIVVKGMRVKVRRQREDLRRFALLRGEIVDVLINYLYSSINLKYV